MPESQGPTVITVSIVFGVLTVFVICLRLFARVILLRRMGLDDSTFDIVLLQSLC